MTGKHRPRVGVLSSHPIQYHSPWFRGLAEHLDLQVFYAHRQSPEQQAQAGYGVAFEWDMDLLAGYEHRFLTNVAAEPGVYGFGGCNTPEIHQTVAEGSFDAFVVTGWYLRSYLQVVAACRRRGVPLLVRGDSQLGTSRGLAKALAKEVAYRALMAQYAGFLCVGTRFREYVQHYGVSADRCFSVPHFVDNARFASQSIQSAAERQQCREGLGVLPGERAVLFVGRFVGFKRPLDLVEAVARLCGSGQAARAVFVGAGELEAQIRQRAAQLTAPISLVGFKNQTELPAIYAACDCLALPSTAQETWGLVVNEAMASGTPAVVSEQAGCAPDMIRSGRTGERFRTGDVADLARALLACFAITDAPERQTWLQEVLQQHSLASAVQGTREAVAAVTGAAP